MRLKEYLHAELEKIAARENRSLTNLVNHLLEQAVAIESGAGLSGVDPGGSKRPHVEPPAPVQADSQARDVAARTVEVQPVDHFRPDPKPAGKKKR